MPVKGRATILSSHGGVRANFERFQGDFDKVLTIRILQRLKFYRAQKKHRKTAMQGAIGRLLQG